MKIFSTVRDTQRGSQSYTEKRRGRREIEVTRRRGGVKYHYNIQSKVGLSKVSTSFVFKHFFFPTLKKMLY